MSPAAVAVNHHHHRYNHLFLVFCTIYNLNEIKICCCFAYHYHYVCDTRICESAQLIFTFTFGWLTRWLAVALIRCLVECLRSAHGRHIRWKTFCFVLQMHIKYIASNDVIHENNLSEAPPACRMRGRISFSAYNNDELLLYLAEAMEWCVLSLACWFAFNTLAQNTHLFSPLVRDTRLCERHRQYHRDADVCVCAHDAFVFSVNENAITLAGDGCYSSDRTKPMRWSLFTSCVFYGFSRSAHHRIDCTRQMLVLRERSIPTQI